MGFGYHLNISTEGKTYEFDLIAKDSNLPFEYKIVPANEDDLPAIQLLLENAQTDETPTIGTLANRLRHLPVVSHVKVTNLFSTYFPWRERMPSSKVLEAQQLDTSQSVGPTRQRLEQPLEKVADRALSLLFPDALSAPTKAEVLKILQEEANRQKLESAQRTPLPGMPDPGCPFPQDDDMAGFPAIPPILSGLTMREVMLLGTVATILGKTETLEAACIDSIREKAPGRFLDIDKGRELFYQPFGDKSTGRPCTIMESGLGHGAYIWTEVQSQLGDATYGLSYDRAGLCFSDPTSKDQASISRVLEDFHTMLTLLEGKREIHPPYILVGHSLGGAFMQLYANQHPEKVKGVVLVDSSSDAQISDPRMPQDVPPPPHRKFPPDDLIPFSTARVLFPQAAHQLNILKEVRALHANLEVLASHTAKAAKEGKPLLRDLPLRVLSRGQFPENGASELADEQQAALEIQQQLTRRSTNSQQVVCQRGIGHLIQIDAPQQVAAIIRDLL